METAVALIQGVYYVVTGIWPVLSIRTFEAITGPKTDKWLVRMVGLLAAAIGVPLLFAVAAGQIDGQLAMVAVLSAFAFLAIDVYYVWKGVIGKIYLADAVLEVVFILVWTLS